MAYLYWGSIYNCGLKIKKLDKTKNFVMHI